MVVIECSHANGSTTIADVKHANPTNHNQEFKMFQKLCCKNNLS